jgi:hypothetical protein
MLLKNIFSKLFANTLYVKVFINSYELRHIESGKTVEVVSKPPFTTTRLLVGEFEQPATVLKKAIAQVYSGENKLFLPSPIVIIQPMAMTEGGLSPVEERCLQELALSAGARKVSIRTIRLLSDSAVFIAAGENVEVVTKSLFVALCKLRLIVYIGKPLTDQEILLK